MRHQARRGASLVEVLFAVIILTIGLTSIIALFPVGVNRVRNATLDTRCTIVAQSAINSFQLKKMGNDPGLIGWALFDSTGGPGVQTFDRYLSTGSGAMPHEFNNAYAIIPWATDPALNIWGMVQSLLGTGAVYNPALDWQFHLMASETEVPVPTGTITVRQASTNFDLSYPVLLDPGLFDQLAVVFRLQDPNNYFFSRGVPRVNIATPLLDSTGTAVVGTPAFSGYYVPLGQANIPYADIPVVTLGEIGHIPWSTTAPPAPALPPWPVEREMVKTHWFASTAGITYSNDVPGTVLNPSGRDFTSAGTTPLLVRDYYDPRGVDPSQRPDATNPVRPTASRLYEYTWAAMLQRQLVQDPETHDTATPNPSVARPFSEPGAGREFRGKVAIMAFYRRNLNQPYSVIEGCFYNGSRKVTLTWPIVGGAAPTINVGTWLCEASIARSNFVETQAGAPAPPQAACNWHTGIYDGLDLGQGRDNYKRHYRRSFSFHRVVEVGEPTNDGTRNYLEVLVERPANGFPLRYEPQASQDLRPVDPYPSGANPYPQWPLFDRNLGVGTADPGYDNETNVTQGALGANGRPAQFYPVIIFDGLREVYQYSL